MLFQDVTHCFHLWKLVFLDFNFLKNYTKGMKTSFPMTEEMDLRVPIFSRWIKGNKLCILDGSVHKLLIKEVNDGCLTGHFGINKSIDILKEKFCWQRSIVIFIEIKFKAHAYSLCFGT